MRPALRRSSLPASVTWAVVAYAAVAAIVATVWPLSSYTLSLAGFGLAHVLTELRYVDARFGTTLPRAFWRATGAALGLVVALRMLGIGGLAASSTTATGELAIVALLFAMAAPLTLRRAATPTLRVLAATAAVVAVGVAAGAIAAPVPTLLLFAVLHNTTPALFLVERAPAGRRAVVAVATTALFVGVPAFVGSGLLQALLTTDAGLDRGPWNVGILADHFRAYLPPSLHADARATRLFSAAVTAQLLHYGAVIVWLPRTLGGDEHASLPWPSWGRFAVVVVALSLGLLLHFLIDFAGARAAYGVIAAVHAWVEWPVLVAGFAGARLSAGSSLQQS